MTELIIKMVLCLLAALLLGFLIGWLLSKVIQAKRHLLTLDKLNSDLADKNDEVLNLKSKYADKKSMLLKLSDENRELNAFLEDKSKLVDERSLELTQVQQSLNIAENRVNENFSAKEHNQALVQQVNNLEKLYVKKNDEIQGLEEVLVKAENTIEALTLKNEEISNAVLLYQQTISDLEEELKISSSSKEDDEFIISKDQFTHIEDQLVQYQKEIDILKEEKKGLLVKRKEVEVGISKDEVSELDDGSIVKLFRDTYKKITKT